MSFEKTFQDPHHIIENASIGIFTTTPQDRYIFANPALARIYGYATPQDYDPKDNPEGHICYDVIQKGSNSPVVISNLQESPYAQTENLALIFFGEVR